MGCNGVMCRSQGQQQCLDTSWSTLEYGAYCMRPEEPWQQLMHSGSERTQLRTLFLVCDFMQTQGSLPALRLNFRREALHQLNGLLQKM